VGVRPVSEEATARMREAAGARGKRLAIWFCLLVLPLGFEASNLIAGPHAFYGGDKSRWFAGLDVRLALTAASLAVILWSLRRSGESLQSIGWPRRLRAWEIALIVLVLAGATAAVFYHPPTISPLASKLTASTPVTLLERGWLLVLAVAESLVQELVWRGAMITWLEPRLGTGGAALLSVASYVFFHPTFGLSWQALRVALPVAALYTFLFLWRRSVGPSALVHFILTAGQLLSPI